MKNSAMQRVILFLNACCPFSVQQGHWLPRASSTSMVCWPATAPPTPPILLLKDALELCELAGVSSTVVAWR